MTHRRRRYRREEDLVAANFKITPMQDRAIDNLVYVGLFPDRSEAFRHAITDLIKHFCPLIEIVNAIQDVKREMQNHE